MPAANRSETASLPLSCPELLGSGSGAAQGWSDAGSKTVCPQAPQKDLAVAPARIMLYAFPHAGQGGIGSGGIFPER